MKLSRVIECLLTPDDTEYVPSNIMDLEVKFHTGAGQSLGLVSTYMADGCISVDIVPIEDKNND